MNSTERRMQIYLMMQNKKNLHIKDLAQEFEVNKRTIYRDLNYLRNLNVPITHDPEFGYGIMRDAHIKPLMFTNRELAIIMMGLSFLKSQSDELIVEDAIKVQNKIHSAIPGELKEFLSAIEKKVIVSPYERKVSELKKGGNWFTVLSAIANNKPVSFSYISKSGKSSERIIDPYIIAYFTDHWNVIGYCHTQNDYRNFILDQMANPSIPDRERFTNRNPGINELLYGRQKDTTEITVSVNNKIADQFIKQLPAHILHILDNPNKKQITFLFDDLGYINTWLLQYTDHIQIVAPQRLKDLRRDLVSRL